MPSAGVIADAQPAEMTGRESAWLRRGAMDRAYSPADVQKVEMIVALKRFHFSLAEIRELLTAKQDQWDRYPLKVQRQEIESAIVDLTAFQATLERRTIRSNREGLNEAAIAAGAAH
jgi:DNA-binding transcriptional MerR regulator